MKKTYIENKILFCDYSLHKILPANVIPNAHSKRDPFVNELNNTQMITLF